MIPLPNKKYNIIYADPAWKYTSGFLKRNWSDKYETMKAEDIYKLPVNNIADKNCILFLWVTFPKLLEGIETIKQWGFTYKSCAFTWVKKNKISESFFWGMGHWTRANAECCLLAVKGKPQRKSKSVHSIICEKIENHSKKPNCTRERIIQLCGDLPRIELFARQKTEGWDSWGNEL